MFALINPFARCNCSESYNDEAPIYEIGGFDYPKQKDPNDLLYKVSFA